MSDSFGTRWVNALRSEWSREGYPRRPQPAAGRRRAAFKPSAPSGRASAASGCGRTGITRLRQLRRGIAATCSVCKKRRMCSLRRGRNVILPGQYYDAETGLNYNYFRDFDPATGRYVESDPIGLRGGINTYAYAGSNPLFSSDPTGQNAIALPIGIGVGIGVIACYLIPNCWQGVSDAVNGLLNPPPSYPDPGQAAGDSAQAQQSNATQPPAATQNPARQAEYLYAKNFCDDNQPPPTGNECSDLSRQIDHAEACIALYQARDAKWLPGRHDEKIQTWQNRLNNLKDEHMLKCTNKCP